jgi:hypothetical protein
MTRNKYSPELKMLVVKEVMETASRITPVSGASAWTKPQLKGATTTSI